MKNRSAALTSVLHGVFDAALLYDSTGRVVDYNAEFAKLTGLSPRALRKRFRNGGSVSELVRATDGCDQEALESCLENQRGMRLAEVQLVTGPGKLLTAWLAFVPLPGTDGQLEGVLEVIRDVSAEARTHERFKELLAQKQARAEELERVVAARTQELTAALEEVTRLSRTDYLTGLTNRRALTEAAETLVAKAGREGSEFAVVLCDLDNFKALNDTHGHHSGDLVLSAVAERLRECAPPDGLVGRFGGEELILVLPDADEEVGVQVAEECRRQVASLPLEELVPGKREPQTASFGVAIFPSNGETFTSVLNSADAALYAAKDAGRNRVELGRPGAHHASQPDTSKGTALIVMNDRAAGRFAAALETTYAISLATDYDLARALCAEAHFDVVIAGDALESGSGVELLTCEQHANPVSVRVLYETIPLSRERGAPGRERIDLTVTGPDDVAGLIDDAITRRAVLREQLVAGTRRLATGRPPSPSAASATLLDQIIEQERFAVAYQPIVHGGDRTVFGHEALCRPVRRSGMDSSELFEAAERFGRIKELGRAIRAHVLPAGASDGSSGALFINISPVELEDADEMMREPWFSSCCGRLVLELTEQRTRDELTRVRFAMHRLRERGVRFALDDLGTGHSSLQSLAELPLDFLKIDIGVVHAVHRSEGKQRLVHRIVEFATKHGLSVVAEGVESEQEARFLIESGCDYLQGFRYGMPAARASRPSV